MKGKIKMIPAEKILNLKGSITPQCFSMREGEFYFYDRMNMHEGRFCKLQEDNTEVLFEIIGCQGLVKDGGELYTLEIGERTNITNYNPEGVPTITLALEGIYFDFKKDDGGNYICLGNIDNKSIIKILNNSGLELGSIIPQAILFGSSIWVKGDSIFIAGFDDKNRYILEKINYLGALEKRYVIGKDKCKGIISKIAIEGDNLIAMVSGKRDYIIISDLSKGESIEVFPENLGIKGIVDFFVVDGEIYILYGNKIYKYLLGNLIKEKMNTKGLCRGVRIDFDSFHYVYMLYIIGIEKTILFSIMVASLSIIIIFLVFRPLISRVSTKEIISLFSFSFFMASYVISNIKVTIFMGNKATRIENLLKLSNGLFKEPSFVTAIYKGIAAYSFIKLILYPIKGYLLALSFGVIIILLTLLFQAISLKRIKEVNKEVIVELLYENDFKIINFIDKVIKNIRESGDERLIINIFTIKSPEYKKILKWAESRREIVGGRTSISLEEKKITTFLDLTRRNKKYSRFTIIMDYICFVRSQIDIDNIEISMFDKNKDHGLR